MAGYGYPTGFFLGTRVDGRDVLVQNDRFGWRFFGRALSRTPRPMMISPRKAPGACRVFVFGESAAYGDPKPDFGLPRFLQVLLRDAFPDKNPEVINVAMTGINSHAILPIARDCAPLQGDIWVLYMGNNEVVGPFGSGTVFGPAAPPMALIRASLALQSTRTGQLMMDLLRRLGGQKQEPREWGMQLFLGAQVAHDDPRMRTVYAHFSRNLSDILKLAERHGVRVVLATVATNLKDCAPFASMHRPGLSEDQLGQFDQLFRAGRGARLAGAASLAIEKFQEAARIDDRFAELHFEWADCSLAMGRKEDALRHFSLARDLDTLRFRTDSRLNEIIRQTASSHASQGVLLADCEAMLARQSPSGILGEESLYEHVHFNFPGNYRAACCIAEQIQNALGPSAPSAGDRPYGWLSVDACADRLAWTVVDQCRALKSVMLRIAEAPFTSQSNHTNMAQRLERQVEPLLSSLKPQGLRAASLVYSNAVLLQPDDWVLHRNYADLLMKLGDTSGAERNYTEVIRLLPRDSLAYIQLGTLMLQADRPRDAIDQFQIALRLDPDSIVALNSLAIALTGLGGKDAAMRCYERALAIHPLSCETHLNLSTALESWGEKEKAVRQLREALRHPPDRPELRMRLGKACAARGWFDAAITNFARAVELDSSDSMAHFYLGSALAEARNSLRAQGHLAEAVRLDPDSAQLRSGLGKVLLKLGRNDEALEQLSRAVCLDPGLVEARVHLAIAQLRTGNTAEARLNFERVLQIDPANPIAKNALTPAARRENKNPQSP